jgi:large subunit ribosomal protein L13
MKTIMPKPITGASRKWYLIDAQGKTLGRLATQIATILRGKNKVDFAPHVDNGDYVIVLNAASVRVSGNKLTDKLYHTHSGFMGGLKTTTLEQLNLKKPGKALELAVVGMLPKNKLRRDMLSRLKLQLGESHPYEAQKPVVL